jgi:hypothetical protein
LLSRSLFVSSADQSPGWSGHLRMFGEISVLL